MSINIRAAEEKDEETVYRFLCLLEERVFDRAAFSAMYRKNIHKQDHYYYIAEAAVENEAVIIAGYISCHAQNLLHHCGKVCEIQELYVESGFRKKGIGGLLVAHLQARLVKANVVLLEVSAQMKRTGASLFYEKLGLRHTHNKYSTEL